MIETLEIPVTYKKIPEMIEGIFHSDEIPSIIIMTGIAEGIAGIQLERVAINEATARIAYQDGTQPVDEKIIFNGPAAYFTRLPIRDINKNLQKKSIPANISYSAGTYACNQAFYLLMHQLDKINPTNGETSILPPIGGFIHLPITPELAVTNNMKVLPSMSLELMIRAIKIAIETTIESISPQKNEVYVSNYN